jgi:hypothetical protein
MTTKEELRRIVEALNDETAAELLDYARWLQQERETLTEEERARVTRGEEEIQRGETVAWDHLRRELKL